MFKHLISATLKNKNKRRYIKKKKDVDDFTTGNANNLYKIFGRYESLN
jgi:5,10-methylene-tetrahydrofolate dehydrogenase/methenyl tetrahydrofolate cyclohydrolase